MKRKYYIALAALFLLQPVFAAEIPERRAAAGRVQDNKGIELILFKKMTDANTEHFSVRNTTSFTITDIRGRLVYRDMQGNQITTQDFVIAETLAPGEAELSSIPSFDQQHRYSFHKSFDPRGLPPGVRPFMVELVDISYMPVSIQ